MSSMSMGTDLIMNWQARRESLFGRHAIKLRHRLTESSLFTGQALASIIERCRKHEFGLEAKAASASIWKKLGRQISGHVVKRRDFHVDAASPNGREDLAA